MSGQGDLHDLERFPGIEARALAWFALGRARLTPDLRPSRRYEEILVSVMLAHLALKSTPSTEQVIAAVEDCRAELRTAAFASAGPPSPEYAAAWSRAAAWLRLAAELAAAGP